MTDFTLTFATFPQAIVVKITGQLHVSTEGLEYELDLIALSRPQRVIVDLSTLNFISSLGLSALVSFNRTVTRHGGIVRLAAIGPRIEGGFRFTRITDLIPAFPTVQAAIDSPWEPTA